MNGEQWLPDELWSRLKIDPLEDSNMPNEGCSHAWGHYIDAVLVDGYAIAATRCATCWRILATGGSRASGEE